MKQKNRGCLKEENLKLKNIEREKVNGRWWKKIIYSDNRNTINHATGKNREIQTKRLSMINFEFFFLLWFTRESDKFGCVSWTLDVNKLVIVTQHNIASTWAQIHTMYSVESGFFFVWNTIFGRKVKNATGCMMYSVLCWIP